MNEKVRLGSFLSNKMKQQQHSRSGKSIYHIKSYCNIVVFEGKLMKFRGGDTLTASKLLASMMKQEKVMIMSNGIAYFFIKEEDREQFEKMLEFSNWKKNQYKIYTELTQMESVNNFLLFLMLAFKNSEIISEDLLKKATLKLDNNC